MSLLTGQVPFAIFIATQLLYITRKYLHAPSLASLNSFHYYYKHIPYPPEYKPISTRRGPNWGGGLFSNTQFTSNIYLLGQCAMLTVTKINLYKIVIGNGQFELNTCGSQKRL